MSELTDTHCHVHEALGKLKGEDGVSSVWQRDSTLEADTMVQEAADEGITKLICVGTTLEDSERAAAFASSQSGVWASIGVHPHEAKDYISQADKLKRFHNLLHNKKVVAIGECGLDYHYMHSSKENQEKILRFQIYLAQQHNLPLIFHVREAHEDFQKIISDYQGLCGVVHSFSAGKKELNEILDSGLYVGLNGIVTFTKDEDQLDAAKVVPLDRLLLETDAPFLTPAPLRGKICQPKYLRVTAEFLAKLREESLETLAAATTLNAKELFRLI